MKLLATLFTAIFLFYAEASAQKSEFVKSVSQPESINPQLITSYKDKTLSNIYVSVITALINKIDKTQLVVINIGDQENASESYSFTVKGEVANVLIEEDMTDGTILVYLTTKTEPQQAADGPAAPGFRRKVIRILKQSGTATGYSSTAEVLSKYYNLNL